MLEGGGIGGLVFDSSGVVGRGLVSNKALICSSKWIRFVYYIGLVFESE